MPNGIEIAKVPEFDAAKIDAVLKTAGVRRTTEVKMQEGSYRGWSLFFGTAVDGDIGQASAALDALGVDLSENGDFADVNDTNWIKFLK